MECGFASAGASDFAKASSDTSSDKAGFGLGVTDYGSRITDYGSRITDHGLPVSGPGS